MKIDEGLKPIILFLFVVGMCVAGAVEPMANALTAVLGGGALCAICVKHGFLWGAGVSVLGGIAALLFCRQVGPAGVSLAAVACVAFVLAYCIRRGKNYKSTMAAGIITVVAVNGAISLIGAYLTYGTVSPAVILKPVLDMVDTVYGPMLAAQEGAGATMDNIKRVLTNSYVGYTVVASLVSAYFTFLWGSLVLARVYNFDMSEYRFFDHFRVSFAGGIVFAVSFIMMLFASAPILKLAFSNFIIIMSPVFLLGGLSVAKFYLIKFKVGPKGRAAVYIMIFSTAMMPYFSLVNGMVAVGMIDSLVNYRKL